MAVKHTPGKKVSGFTLVESIISIVVMGFAMLSLITFLFPQVEDSARPHYEVRASALAQSLMTEVISKGFDENSDPDGGVVRCGENSTTCTAEADFGSAIDSEGDNPGLYDDVDDYKGCWITNSASSAYCSSLSESPKNLSDIFGTSIADDYPNFAADISVVYDNDSDLNLGNSNIVKRITIVITAGRYGSFSFSAYRGNY